LASTRTLGLTATATTTTMYAHGRPTRHMAWRVVGESISFSYLYPSTRQVQMRHPLVCFGPCRVGSDHCLWSARTHGLHSMRTCFFALNVSDAAAAAAILFLSLGSRRLSAPLGRGRRRYHVDISSVKSRPPTASRSSRCVETSPSRLIHAKFVSVLVPALLHEAGTCHLESAVRPLQGPLAFYCLPLLHPQSSPQECTLTRAIRVRLHDIC
jgi:hypothetical protein